MNSENCRQNQLINHHKRNRLEVWIEACDQKAEALDDLLMSQAREAGAIQARRARAEGQATSVLRAKMWTLNGLAVSLLLCALAGVGLLCLVIPLVFFVLCPEQSSAERGKKTSHCKKALTVGMTVVELIVSGFLAACMIAGSPLIRMKRKTQWALAEMSLLSPEWITMNRFWTVAGLNPYSAAAWALNADQSRAENIKKTCEAICVLSDGQLFFLIGAPSLRAWARQPIGWLWRFDLFGFHRETPWEHARRMVKNGLYPKDVAAVERWMLSVDTDAEREAIEAVVVQPLPAVPRKVRRL